MRTRAAAALALLLGAPLAALDHPAMPEHADHAADRPGAMHAHDDTLVPRTPTLLTGYGVGGFPITTRVPGAQAFFSNGMELGAAFAHSAAEEAMKHAVALDPTCAMCKWGEALVAGPTINFGKDEKERVPLRVLADEAARQAAAGGTAREQALTAALAERYRPGAPAKRDLSYAAAMETVQRRFPEDKEIAVLTADALMVAAFAGDKPDHALLGRSLALLQDVLARDPNHTPAIHFYIHAAEVMGLPERAEPYADRLEALAPRASHLVHMPSHTWFWRGRYEDAARANLRAVNIGKENAARLGLPGPDGGVWGLPYHAHNVIYGLGGALMAGDAEVALELARPLVRSSQDQADGPPVMQLLSALGYDAIARFAPQEVAGLPEPRLTYLKAAWHYARGEAAASAGDVAAVAAERDAIPARIARPSRHQPAAPEQMLAITRAVLAGRLAILRGAPADAARDFREAAQIEETPSFNDFTDPPAFWYPVRRDLAAALLAAGDVAGARREAEASLKLRMKDPVAEALLARTATAAR